MFERAFSPKSLINKWKHNVFIIRLLHTYTQTHSFSYFTWISFYHNFQEREWVVKMSLTDFAAITHSFIPLSLLLSAIASALFLGRSSIFFNWRKQAQMNFNRMLILGLKRTFNSPCIHLLIIQDQMAIYYSMLSTMWLSVSEAYAFFMIIPSSVSEASFVVLGACRRTHHILQCFIERKKYVIFLCNESTNTQQHWCIKSDGTQSGTVNGVDVIIVFGSNW